MGFQAQSSKAVSNSQLLLGSSRFPIFPLFPPTFFLGNTVMTKRHSLWRVKFIYKQDKSIPYKHTAVCTQGAKGNQSPFWELTKEGTSSMWQCLSFPGRSLSSQAHTGANGGSFYSCWSELGAGGKVQGPALLPLHEPVSSSLSFQRYLKKTLSRSVNKIA